MKLLSAFWRYWKWLCVALMTSFVVLALFSYFILYIEMPEPDRPVRECIDAGGTWDAEAGHCKTAA